MLFADRYELRSELGRGAAARVFHALDVRLQREVAVKVLLLDGELADANRFRDEAQALASFQHPHVVELLDFGSHGGKPYMVLEYLPGGTLQARGGKLEVAAAARIATQLLKALHAGHRRGILHRDIKPANILVDAAGNPKLSDYGLAKFLGRTGRTSTGLVVGTPEYMAPELFLGSTASPASDLYAWACTYHHLLKGAPPITGDLAAIIQVATSGTWQARGLSGSTQAILAAALHPDPSQRATSEAVLAWLSGASPPPRAPPLHAGEAGPETVRLGPPAPSRPAAAAPQTPPSASSRGAGAFAAALALAGSMTGAYLWLGGPSRVPATPPPKPLSEGERATRWIDRVAEVAPAARLEALHAELVEVVPKLSADNYGVAMRRHARSTSQPEATATLAQARLDLPYRADFQRDREALRTYLARDQVPLAGRWALYEALLKLAHLDAYLVTFGAAPAYDAEPLLAALAAPQAEDLLPGSPMAEAPPPPAKGPLPSGRFRLHRWPATWDKAKYVLVPAPQQPNQTEHIAWMATGMVGEEHAAVYGEIDLGPSPAEDLEAVTVEATIANLVAPNLLLIRWNLYEFAYRTPPSRLKESGSWKVGGFPDHRVVLELPLASLRPGRNTLRIRTRPLPGLPHALGPNLDLVGVRIQRSAP